MAKRDAESIPLSRFGVLVAQLSSIVASAPQQPPDALLCFDLLSELVAAIEEESKESIQQSQRKCEDALFSLLILGARRPVRRLASTAMGRVISKGDGISIYSRASTVQGWLVDSKKNEPLSCAGASQCLGELYRLFGRRITSGLMETFSIVAKLMKFHEDFVRRDAMQMLENALEGCGGGGASAAYSEAFRIIMRLGVGDKSFTVRVAAAKCLKTFASIGGPGLGISELENSILYCIKALDDPVSSVRDAFAESLGGLLALAMNPDAQIKQKGSKNSTPKKWDDGLQKHLILPFVRATGVRAKNQKIGLSLSWVFFLQVVRLKYQLPDSELQNYALLVMDMLQGNASEDAHALACVLYILQVGIADQMTEPTQRSFLIFLGRKLESADYNPSKKVAVLRILSYLLTTLGEVPAELKDVLDDTVVAALSDSSLHVRTEAALTLRALAEVDPTCVGGLISFGVTTLYALRESGSFEKGAHLNFELNSLHGQAALLAALVAISPKLLLGYPTRLPQSVFEVSKKMLTEFSRNHLAATVEKEAGWFLLASLIASMPKKELEDQAFDILILWAGSFTGNPEACIKLTQDLSSELRVLSAAVEALTAFIKSFLSPILAANISNSVLLQPVLSYLSGALAYILQLTPKRQPNIKTMLALFTIRTLLAYNSIPNPMVYKSEHQKIVDICVTPFSDPSGCEESTSLRTLLDKRDACLGPWIPGRDWYEDELRAFNGDKDGLLPCVWDNELGSFPQSESMSKMLVNQMLLGFGTMFASQDNVGKLVLLNKIEQCLKNGKKQSWRVASITNACVALLSGLKAAAALRVPKLAAEVLSTIQAIFQGILAEGETLPAQRRACAEGLGLLARLGNDVFTARMTRSLLGELGVATDNSYLASLALSLGCIYRSAGGMALSTLVTSAVNSISALAKSSNAMLQLWSLHSLLLTIEAAGLSYFSQVQAILFLAMEILLSEENGFVDVRQEIGRLVNAIVAILGPELAPGSTFFSRCKSVIAEVSSCQETSTTFESVRFTQQLVLFAPHAASVHSHVQILLPTLSSRQPSLRHLAVATVRHLIEKDPVPMIDMSIEENLFSMLDEETDPEIVALIRATIIQWLYTSCPSYPSRWLNVFHNMVLATAARRNPVVITSISGNNNSNGPSDVDGSIYHDGDDEDMIATSRKEQSKDSDSALLANSNRVKHLRYRTRLFASECLSYLLNAVGSNPAHFDLSLARVQNSSGDWLALHLQELISLSYQISTGQFEGMQPIGVKLLSIIMEKFGSTLDPDLSGHLLLEQYQAQFVSAVRAAVSTSSGPQLLETGLLLATQLLTSKIISSDRVALGRMYTLISRPLDEIEDLYYPSFAEWVACKIKLRLLSAHASVKCYIYQFLREEKEIPDEYQQLVPLFSTNATILGKYWISILKDYIYICFGLQSKFGYKPFLDGIQSPVVSFKVKEYLDEAWSLIFQATALDAVPGIAKKIPDSDVGVTSVSSQKMIKLEASEFQFLWGLSLLVIFQEDKVLAGRQIKPLLAHNDGKRSGVAEAEAQIASFDIALEVLKCFLGKDFFSSEFLSEELCSELFQVLIYSQRVDSWKLSITLLLQILQLCPDIFFDSDRFTTSAIELYFKYLMAVFGSGIVTLQGEDVLSDLSAAANIMTHRMNHMKRWKLVLALISICNKLFLRASTVIEMSKVAFFLQSIMPCLKEHLIAETEPESDGSALQKAVLGAWMKSLAAFLEDCIKRICLERKTSDSCKTLSKILVIFLEEAVSIAREAMELQNRNAKDSSTLFNVLKTCVSCISGTLSTSNAQVQALGLYVLKIVAQREIAEGTKESKNSFFLLLTGELLGDIFAILRDNVKERMSKEYVTITDDCLRLFFLAQTLARASEYQQSVTILLLEALLLVYILSTDGHSQELNVVNSTARKMVSHLVQIPSIATQIKDVMLTMPALRRQQIQDIIRASVTGQMATSIKLNMQPGNTIDVSQKQPSTVVQVVSGKYEKIGNDDDVNYGDSDDNAGDDEDDWDAFQSLPANVPSALVDDSPADQTRSDLVSSDVSSPISSHQSDKRDAADHNPLNQAALDEVVDVHDPLTGLVIDETHLKNEYENGNNEDSDHAVEENFVEKNLHQHTGSPVGIISDSDADARGTVSNDSCDDQTSVSDLIKGNITVGDEVSSAGLQDSDNNIINLQDNSVTSSHTPITSTTESSSEVSSEVIKKVEELIEEQNEAAAHGDDEAVIQGMDPEDYTSKHDGCVLPAATIHEVQDNKFLHSEDSSQLDVTNDFSRHHHDSVTSPEKHGVDGDQLLQGDELRRVKESKDASHVLATENNVQKEVNHNLLQDEDELKTASEDMASNKPSSGSSAHQADVTLDTADHKIEH